MELEFDKEIDAILRRAQESRGVLMGDGPKKKHLDADAIAAFAENAIPPKSRVLYIEHFADCDRCRRLLTNSMLFISEAVQTADSGIRTPVVEAAIPWYQKLFKTPNLAIAMGGLILIFGGAIGFVLLQNRDTGLTVSQVKESQPRPPSEPSIAGTPAANALTGDASPSQAELAAQSPLVANVPADTTAAKKEMAANKPDHELYKLGTRGIAIDSPLPESELMAKSAPAFEDTKPKDMPSKSPTAGGSSSPLVLGQVATQGDEKKIDDGVRKAEDRDAEPLKKQQAENNRSRADAPPAPSKSGPSRSGPMQNQSNQINSNVFDMAVTRLVGGKSFNNRNGVWYDSAYKNQATSNYRRGTSEYKKLESGLRSIADTLGGTVVLIWKGKAFRIQ